MLQARREKSPSVTQTGFSHFTEKLLKKLSWTLKTFQAIALMELKWLTIAHGSLGDQDGSKSVFCAVFSDLYRGARCCR